MGIGSPDKRMREYYLTIQMRKMKQCFTGMKFAHCEGQSLPKVWLLVVHFDLFKMTIFFNQSHKMIKIPNVKLLYTNIGLSL